MTPAVVAIRETGHGYNISKLDHCAKGKEMHQLTDRAKGFRAAIAAFIDARREAKLKGKDDAAVADASKYDYATWLADAARRVGQIQAVTHVLKATHPDARGSSLHVAPGGLPPHAEIGSHCLGANYAEDVVGNAAAAHFYSFLNLQVEGRRLLAWMQAGDADLQAALSDDADQARGWMLAFASLVREDAQPASHPMAKQLYWLTREDPQDDTQYHLLQPLFASSLAHAVHTSVHEARFSEENKQGRQARHNKHPGESFFEYPNVAEQHLGAPPKPTNKSKHLNISHLNAARLGRNYLLASLPPAAWKPRDGANLLKVDSVLGTARSVFFYFGEVRHDLRELADFLKTDPEPNRATRDRVDAHVQSLVDALALFGAEARRRYAPGWTRDAACRLPACERLWLDPERSELPVRDDSEHPEWQQDDYDFNAAYARGDWADEVATAFGLWLNQQLRGRGDQLVALGAAEMRHFASRAILDVAWPIPQQRHAKAGAA